MDNSSEKYPKDTETEVIDSVSESAETESTSERPVEEYGTVATETAEKLEGDAGQHSIQRARNFIKRNRLMFNTYARHVGLKYEVDQEGRTFAFNGAKGEVLVPSRWFESDEYHEKELQFAGYHELSHFTDMRENPEMYLDNFEQMTRDAEELARSFVARHPGVASVERVAQIYRRELHTLYNCLDDIYVNNMVYYRSPQYGKGREGHDSVVSLYKKLGFENPDLTKSPQHVQMAFALLRDEMLGDECGTSIVSEKVQTVLSRRFAGRTIKQFVNDILKPTGGELKDPAMRYKCIRQLIQPHYVELLEEAVEEALKNEPEQPQNQPSSDDSKQGDTGDEKSNDGQSGESGQSDESGGSDDEDFDPFKDTYEDPRLDNILGDHDQDEVEDTLKHFEEINNMSPEELREYERKQRQKEYDLEHGISEEARQEDTEIQGRIRNARDQMRAFWEGLVGKSTVFRRVVVPRQRRGDFNIDVFIDDYDEIEDARRRGKLDDIKIYDRKEIKRELVDQPEIIEVSLLVDCSGSMAGEGIEAAKNAVALLLYSICDFNQELHFQHKTLRAKTQVIGFDHETEMLKDFDSVSPDDTSGNYDTIVRTLHALMPGGSTDDAQALDLVRSQISDENREKIKAKKLKKIVFEISDGESFDTDATARSIRVLAEEGVIVVGFRIGDLSYGSGQGQSTFDRIWNSKEAQAAGAKGIVIGTNIDILPARLMEELAELLKDITT